MSRVREIALNRIMPESSAQRPPETAQAIGTKAVRSVLINEPGLLVYDQETVPEAFLSPEELARRHREQTPLPGIDQIIAERYATFGTAPLPYVQ